MGECHVAIDDAVDLYVCLRTQRHDALADAHPRIPTAVVRVEPRLVAQSLEAVVDVSRPDTGMVYAVHVCDDRIRERGGGFLSRAQRTVRTTVLRWIGGEASAGPAVRLALPRTSTRGLSEDIGASVELEHVTKEYDTVRAVSDLSLAIEPGSFMTLLGPSGSGKT